MFKIFNNIKFRINLSWLIFDKLFRASLNILLSILLARYLGPEGFGILNYLIAFIFLFTSLSSLGMNPVLTNIIIKSKSNFDNNIIINAYYLRLGVSLISYLLFIFIISILNYNDVYLNYSIIIGSVLIFKSCEILFSYFEAKLLSKFIVISQLVGLIFLGILILIVINKSLNVVYIYYALVIDTFIIFILINYFYFLKIKKFFFILDLSKIKKIVIKSLPILISSLSIIIYMRIDQIMINKLLNEYHLGIYSVSVRYIEIFHFIPKIIIISALPILLASKKYTKDLIKINSTILKLSIFITITIFFTSEFIIPQLFGVDYYESILTTKVLSISILFVFYGVVNEHWYISNNQQKFYAIYVFLGAIINIILNYFLIKSIGIEGAAYSTIFTYFIIIIFLDCTSRKTRPLFKIKFKSFFKL